MPLRSKIDISVVIPVYGCKDLLEELHKKLTKSLSKITKAYEIIFVNDRCPYDSWGVISKICKKDNKVIGVNLSRNFGQQYALNAGLDHTQGDWIVTMDCDLQDNPDEIAVLYKEALKGNDIVFARRKNRKDGFFKKIASKMFYLLLSYLTGTKQDGGVANFVVYNRKVVDALFSMHDYFRYYPVMLNWVGFKSTTLEIPHSERNDDKKSSYSLKARLRLAFNVIVFFSDRALKAILKIGIVMVFLSLILAIILVLKYHFISASVPGWTSIFISVWFLAGINIITIGLVGVYVGKIFENTKNRPRYIVDEILRKEKK